MEKELRELDRNLFDKRRRVGTACVSLHGQPGGGKSHLARQYVYKHRQKFKCGIFWIQATSREERLQDFWNIHEKAVVRESPEACTSVNGEKRYWVAEVKAWFEARHDWLIVFDGLVVDKDEDATEIQGFIPDSMNSSIIYISRARNLESKQWLLRPYPIKVPPLKDEDARKLLFQTLNIQKPTDAETKSAKAIVKQIGGLPLALDAISQRLADSREPLPKFSLKSYSADPRMGGTYNKILDDLERLEHKAWNLINLLCFYGQHIPVEMVHLGLNALRNHPVAVMSSEDEGKLDINNTMSTLIRYALIERNEPDDKDSVSSSRGSFSDPEPIDMLRMQGVVQKFCCDSLNAKHILPEWLGQAVKVFIHSYRQADTKIRQKPEPGRVSDYRYYLVHGKQLWDHSKSYESKNQPLVNIRKELDPVLMMIKEQIQNREPTSSQENVVGNAFQISIFDRTNSTSESGPSMDEAQTPEHRPTSFLHDENAFGIDVREPSVDSPASLGMASPNFEYLIVPNSPGLKLRKDYDPGYESDREPLYSSSEMYKSLSDKTTKPRGSTRESNGSEWQAVPANRKIKPRKQPRRDLGVFRPTPARPEVAMESAKGLVSRSTHGSNRQSLNSHDAFTSLSEVQHRSPPRERQLPGLSPTLQLTQSTYASVVVSQHNGSPPMPLDLASDRPSKNFRNRQENMPPLPITAQFAPRQTVDQSLGATSSSFPTHEDINRAQRQLYNPQYVFRGSASSQSDSPRPRYVNGNFDPSYSYPRSAGPNHTLFPAEGFSQTSRRPFEFSSQGPRYLSSSPPSHSNHSTHSNPPPFIPSTFHNSPPFPSGYYSQPMSRHESHHSHPSLPETEPLRYPSSFSPQPTAISPRSDRDRLPDGRPLRKSPKTVLNDYSMPSYPEHPSPTDPNHDLSGTGGWAYPEYPPPPIDDDLSMSRSSSGPGIAISDAAGDGLGIVRFEDAGLIQFGEHPPISFEDARRRAHQRRVLLSGEEARRGGLEGGFVEGGEWSEERRGRRRGRGRLPYPESNRIRTRTDPVGLGEDGMDLG